MCVVLIDPCLCFVLFIVSDGCTYGIADTSSNGGKFAMR